MKTVPCFLTLLLFPVFVSVSSGQNQDSHWQSKKLSSLFWAEGGTAADLDGDSYIDIIAGPKVFFGPSYEQSTDLVDCKPVSIIGYSQFFFAFDYDIDQDSDIDVLIVGFPGQAAHWYRNPGKEGARKGPWERFTVIEQVDNESPMFCDVTGDGVPELICCNGGAFGFARIPDDKTKLWTFTPVSENKGYQRFTHGLGVGDVNDDGRLDILSKDGWWEHPEEQTTTTWKMHPFEFSGPGGAQMYAVDFDKDGKTEVVTSLAAHGYGLAVYKKKNGSPDDWDRIDIMTDKVETSPTHLAISQLHAIDMADMDGDGELDIVTGKRFWAHNGSDRGENEPPQLVWFKPISTKGGLRFAPNVIDSDSGVGTQIVAKDINGDKRKDVVSVSKRGVHILTQMPQLAPKVAEPSVAQESVSINDALGGFRPAWSAGHVMNVDFEMGDLRDWTSTGAAFFNQPIQGDTVAARRQDMKSEHTGEYWIGSFEVTGDIALGTLTSSTFKLTHPWVSFLLAGGSGWETRAEIVDATSGKVLATSRGMNTENMKRAVIPLEQAMGSNVFIRLIDNSKEGWGHINFDDFRMHSDEPKVPENARLPVLDTLTYKSLPSDKVAEAMTLPPGFSVQVIASEPEVRQPVAMTIDHRGRVWVAEAYQYPQRADGEQGKDRVLIFEDTNGDGTLDYAKVFAEKLNLVSGIEVGFGGLWVGAAPYLLFIPDRNNDDIPDGTPEKKLDGWGYQDTHETLNSFIWGPDGWLYGCHGVFTHSDVRVLKKDGTASEGIKINAGIWRYHPPTESFEVFAHGTSNPWGLDFNDTGDAFLTACVIPHLFHVIPQARYQRQAGQHFNPFTYADIQTIAKHRHWIGDTPHSGNNRSDSAGGGHAHSGAMIYLGGSWPDKYRNQLFMNNIHGARLNQDQLQRHGSGYIGDRAPDFLLANDQSSQILYFRSGPDGQVIAIDWYDAQQCHVNDPAKHDQSNGRIYRITYNNEKPVRVDLSREDDVKLVTHQTNKNDWYARTARRLLMERANAGTLSSAAIDGMRALKSHSESRIRLRGLWSLAACRLLSAQDIETSLQDSDENVRGWAVRLLTQAHAASKTSNSYDSVLEKTLLERMAKSDSSPLVRLELASACQKLDKTKALKILAELLTHAEDNHDHNLPLMYWYAMSRLIESMPDKAIGLLATNRIPLVSEFSARQLAQVWLNDSHAQNGENLILVLKAALAAQDSSITATMLGSVLVALESKRTTQAPLGWNQISDSLMNHTDQDVRVRAAQLASKFNDLHALAKLKELVTNDKAPTPERLSALNILKQVQAEGLRELALSLIDQDDMRLAAISALADNLDETVAPKLLALSSQWESTSDRRAAYFALLRRSNTTNILLDAIEAKKVKTTELTADMVQQIQRLNAPELIEKVAKVWGNVRTLDQDKQKAILKIRALVEKPSSQPDWEAGRVVFKKVCGQCHVLFGEGGKIGPELTGSNRRDLNYLLENIMDPSAVMAKEYQPWIVRTKDDQVITGLLKEQTANSIRLQTATEEVVVYAADIDQKKQSDLSMMPADLLNPLSENEILALFEYLRSSR